MARSKSLLGILMLVLLLCTGGLANAAEPADCIPATVEVAGHFDGDDDQLPSDSEQGVAHHHSGCGGHQLAAADDQGSALVHHSSAIVPTLKRAANLQGHDPDGQLRPPIA